MTFIEKRKFYTAVFVVTFLVLVGLIIFSSTLGVARISFFESIKIMLDKVPLINRLVSTEGIEKTHHIIVLKIRMPRILLAALVGMGLSVVGSTFQGMFKNPMADPYVLGISSGAAFGATIAMILGLGHRMLGMGLTTVLAFTGAIFTTLIGNQIVHCIHQFHLMLNVKLGNRFIQKHDIGLLGKGPCDNNPLSFPSADFIDVFSL